MLRLTGMILNVQVVTDLPAATHSHMQVDPLNLAGEQIVY